MSSLADIAWMAASLLFSAWLHGFNFMICILWVGIDMSVVLEGRGRIRVNPITAAALLYFFCNGWIAEGFLLATIVAFQCRSK